MKTLGRLLVRSGKTAGLFIPFSDGVQDLQTGIWEIREILGELTLVYIGTPAMSSKMYEGLAVDQLLDCPDSAMTPKEWRECCD